MEIMKKILYVIALAALVGCSDEKSEHGFDAFTPEYGARGLVQHGFFFEKDSVHVQMGSRVEPYYWIDGWSRFVPVDGATGAYEIEPYVSNGLMEFGVSASESRIPNGSRVVPDMELKAAADLSNDSTVNVNYLTTLATDMIWSLVREGKEFAEARRSANVAVLSALHMPKDLLDFEKYSLYGEGEGDAMLAAIALVIEDYYVEYGSTTAWESLEIDTLTGKFYSSDVLRRLAVLADAIITDDGGDSIRKAIEAKAPNGKVGHFEKYLTLLATADGNLACDASNEGEMRDIGDDFRYKMLVCSNSAWHPATKENFDVGDIFNPEVEYGTLVDSRDGRTYRTVEIGGYTWMAENLKYADSAASENLKGQSWCYGDDESNCEVLGRLYSWSAAMDLEPVYLDSVADIREVERGICPEGWHVPNPEFRKLYSDVSYASAFMAMGTNESGLSVIPSGYGVAEYDYGDGGADEYTGKMQYVAMGVTTFLWTGDQQPYGGVRVMYLYKKGLSNEPGSRHNAGYLRCVKDYGEEE